MPRDKRQGALRLQTLEWSPYPRAGMMFDISDTSTGVWIWDLDQVESALTGAGLDPAQLRLYPETAIRRPGTDGVRLMQCLDGVEGQVWRRQQLVASRWWEGMPSAVDWARFQRVAGIEPVELQPLPDAPASEDWSRPWPRRGSALSLQRLNLGQIAAAAACAMAIVTAYQAGEFFRLGRAVSDARKANEVLLASAKPIETARSRAIAANARAQAIFGLEGADSQLALMARIAEQLPTNGTLLTGWSYQGSDLNVTIGNTTQPIDSTFIIRKIEGVKNLQVAQVDPSADGKTLSVRIKVKPR